MTIHYGIEETLEDGSTRLWPVMDPLVCVPDFLAFRHSTWLSATADALDMMRKSGWEMVCRAVVTSCSDEEE